MKKRFNTNGYDEGYEDVEDDFDYDADRYERDSSYRDGVEDAFDEFGEED